MRHAEKIAPLAAAATGLATLVCCLPIGIATAALTGSLSAAVAPLQSWLLGASIVLLGVGLVQLRQRQRVCARQPYASLIVFALSAVTVLLVLLFPQLIAGIVADWLP